MEDSTLAMYQVAQEQYCKLSEEEQRLCNYIKKIDYMKALMNLETCEKPSDVIMNFKIKKELGITNISFDIADVSSDFNDPTILYKIIGSLIGTEQVKNFIFKSYLVYGKQSENKESKYLKTIIYQQTKISDSIFLTEKLQNDGRCREIFPNSVALTITTKRVSGIEEIEIEISTEDYYYQQYRHGVIDAITFSNFILSNPNPTKSNQSLSRKCRKKKLTSAKI